MKMRKEKKIKKDLVIEEVKLDLVIGQKEYELIIFLREELQTTG